MVFDFLLSMAIQKATGRCFGSALLCEVRLAASEVVFTVKLLRSFPYACAAVMIAIL